MRASKYRELKQDHSCNRVGLDPNVLGLYTIKEPPLNLTYCLQVGGGGQQPVGSEPHRSISGRIHRYNDRLAGEK